VLDVVKNFVDGLDAGEEDPESIITTMSTKDDGTALPTPQWQQGVMMVPEQVSSTSSPLASSRA